MDSVLQRRPFFRPPSQFEEMFIQDFTLALCFSAFVDAVINLTSYFPILHPVQLLQLPESPVVDVILNILLMGALANHAHRLCKYMLVSHTKLQVFTLYVCTLIGFIVPDLIFNFAIPQDLYLTTLTKYTTSFCTKIFYGCLYCITFVNK